MNERHAMWHRMTAEAVCEQLHTDAACGLSRKAARSRFKKQGANTLFDSGRGELYRLLPRLASDVALLLLLFSLVLSLVFSKTALALTTLFVLGACIGIWIRALHKAQKSEGCIRRYRIPKVRVIREGKVFFVSADRVAVGDLLLLREGDIVPADCRLILMHDLHAVTLMPNEAGKPVFARLKKSAQFIYPYGSRTEAPYLENMLYAGSEILCGEARGIVTEIGKDTYLGGIDGFSIPGELHGERGAQSERTINALRPYLRLWGIAMLLFLLVFSIIGFFSVTREKGFLDIFVPLSAMCAAASPLCILLYFRMLSIHGKTEAMHAEPIQNQAVIKSERGSEALASLTDLFVIGHKASSDGISHFYRAALPDGEIAPKTGERFEALQPLCEAFCLLRASQQEITKDPFVPPARDLSLLCDEMIVASGFDIEAMRIRLLHAYRSSSPYETDQKIRVQTKEAEFSLLFSGDVKTLDRCFLYTHGGRHFSLSNEKREELKRFYTRMEREGAESIIVAKQNSDGILSFLGILSTREEMQAILPSVIEELAQSGVRTTFFFSEGSERELAYARACRIMGKARICLAEERFVEDADFEAHRIFIGLSRESIARLLQRLRNGGSRVAVLGAEVQDRDLLRLAHLVIACDPTTHRQVVRESELTRIDRDQGGDRCAQVIRRRADILIHRAQRLGGGASAILGAMSRCRSVSIKMRLLFEFLIVSQISRLLLTFFTLCFGMGTLSGAQTVYTGFFVESVAAFWILTVPIPQNRLRRYQAFGAKRIESILFDARTYLPACIATFTTTLLLSILRWTGVLEEAELSSTLFLSLLLLQLTVLYQTVFGFGVRSGVKKAVLPATLLFLPVLLAVLLCILFSPVDSVIGLGRWSVVSGISVMAMPAFYWLSRFFLSFFHRTAK